MSYEPIKLDQMIIQWRWSAVPGTLVCQALDERHPCPVGTVYFRLLERDTRIDILDSFVVYWARRQGVRQAINNWLITAYPGYHLYSAGGTKEGAAFMRAYGYRELKNGAWVFRHRKGQVLPGVSA